MRDAADWVPTPDWVRFRRATESSCLSEVSLLFMISFGRSSSSSTPAENRTRLSLNYPFPTYSVQRYSVARLPSLGHAYGAIQAKAPKS